MGEIMNKKTIFLFFFLIISFGKVAFYLIPQAEETTSKFKEKDNLTSMQTAQNTLDNIRVISDDSSLWNNEDSRYSSIAIDSSNSIHVVWQDETIGLWGDDIEIMYCNYTSATGWSNATVISDDSSGWNNEDSKIPSIGWIARIICISSGMITRMVYGEMIMKLCIVIIGAELAGPMQRSFQMILRDGMMETAIVLKSPLIVWIIYMWSGKMIQKAGGVEEQ
jgi:hypothetical protein